MTPPSETVDESSRPAVESEEDAPMPASGEGGDDTSYSGAGDSFAAGKSEPSLEPDEPPPLFQSSSPGDGLQLRFGLSPVPHRERMLLNFGGWLGDQPAALQEAWQRHMDTLPDDATRLREHQKLVNMYAVAEANPQVPPDDIYENWDIVRGGEAEQRGWDWEAVKDDEAGFHEKLRAEAQQQRDEREFLNLEAQVIHGLELGEAPAEVFTEWQAEVRARNGSVPEHATLFLKRMEAFHAGSNASALLMSAMHPLTYFPDGRGGVRTMPGMDGNVTWDSRQANILERELPTAIVYGGAAAAAPVLVAGAVEALPAVTVAAGHFITSGGPELVAMWGTRAAIVAGTGTAVLTMANGGTALEGLDAGVGNAMNIVNLTGVANPRFPRIDLARFNNPGFGLPPPDGGMMRARFAPQRGAILPNDQSSGLQQPQFSRVPNAYQNTRYKVNMAGAPPGSRVNAAGHPRDGRWFWKRLLKTNPELFSADNVRAIKTGEAPLIDQTWIDKNPMHQGFVDDRLTHHHYDQANIAIALPEQVHRIFYKNPVLHPNL